MEIAILATVLGCAYLLVGTFFVALNASVIAKARKTFGTRWRYALYCTFTWPWVKVDK
jgi:hypothetical protein